MQWKRICLGFFLFGWLTFQVDNAIAEREVVCKDDSLYKELMPVAIKWKDAVLNKQVQILGSYALPEARKAVISDLRNVNSDLYRLFYIGSNSFYERLRRAKNLKIVFVKEKELERFGQGTLVYYYDETRITPKFPLVSVEETSLSEKGEILAMFFFKIEGHWFASYEFFDNDAGDEAKN